MTVGYKDGDGGNLSLSLFSAHQEPAGHLVLRLVLLFYSLWPTHTHMLTHTGSVGECRPLVSGRVVTKRRYPGASVHLSRSEFERTSSERLSESPPTSCGGRANVDDVIADG